MKNFVYFVAMFLLVNSAAFAGESRKLREPKVIKIQKIWLAILQLSLNLSQKTNP